MSRNIQTAGPRKAAVFFIFITVLLDVLGFGVIIPILPKLVVQLAGGDTARGAEIFGLFGTVWALMQFGASPFLGALSDRYGRRPVILLSNLGLGLDYILMALAPNLSWLFVGRLISGFPGASFNTAGAYIADTTTPQKRAAGFGMLGAAFGIGFVLGPAFGGLLGGWSPRLPFWVAAALTLLNFAYGYFLLPESLKPKHRSEFTWKKANPISSLNLLLAHPGLFGLAWVNFLTFMGHAVLPSVFVLFAGYRFGWDARMVGFSLAVVGVCSGLVQGALTGPFVKKFGERSALLTGILMGIIGFIFFGWAPTSAWFWAGLPFLSLWGLSGPAVQSLMTEQVKPQEQGKLQGANGSLRAITEILGPGLYTFTFAFFIAKDQTWNIPGAPFYVASLFLAVSLPVAWKATRKI